MSNKSLAIFFLFLFAGLMAMQFIASADFNQPISDEDKETFDQILDPVMKVYNFVKYSATILAVVVLLFAGINYLISGSNPAKREQAKNMITYVVIGLVVIWAAPLAVSFLAG